MIVDGRRGADALDLRRTIDQLPWPNVRGKRCLALASAAEVAEELRRRGAAEVVSVEAVRELAGTGEPFDVVVSTALLGHVDDPIAALEAVGGVTRGMLLSVEPIDLWRSVLGRGTPWVQPLTDAGARTFNGSGHKQLLVDAGFAIERVSRPFPAGAAPAGAGPLHAMATRAITGSRVAGQLHRALLARWTG